MRVWRGIFTRESREFVLARPFGCLLSTGDSALEPVLAKILSNEVSIGSPGKPTSFSKSRAVALRHAGFRGWLLEVEVPADVVLDAGPYLERMLSTEQTGTLAYERIAEAMEMALDDEEVFPLVAAAPKIVGISMVGSFEPRASGS